MLHHILMESGQGFSTHHILINGSTKNLFPDSQNGSAFIYLISIFKYLFSEIGKNALSAKRVF